MKKVFNVLFVLSFVFAISCKTNTNSQFAENNKVENTNPNTKLEVLYFHATMRCVTCNAVENMTKKILEETFQSQIGNGAISFKSINVDDSENRAISEKYEVSFSTLLLINHKSGKEEVMNFTETAFKYANNEPDKYSELLKSEINKILN